MKVSSTRFNATQLIVAFVIETVRYGTFESGFCAPNFFAGFKPFVFLFRFLAFMFSS